MNKRTILCLVICIVFVAVSHKKLFSQGIPPYVTGYISEFEVSCRKEVGGVFFDVVIPIPLNSDPDNTPNAPGTFGTVRLVGGNDRVKENCNGDVFDYAEVNIDMNWVVIDPLFGQFDHTHNLAFWNHYYEDYDGPEQNACDYSQNCHGYAFGVGDWPVTAGVLLNAYPLSGIGHCYQGASIKDATIASYPIAHSIKVTGAECDRQNPGGENGGSGNPGPGFGFYYFDLRSSWHTMLFFPRVLAMLKQDPIPEDPELGKQEIFVFSSEQFRESGTYTQTSSCEDGGVDINKAHAQAGVITYVFGIQMQGYPFLTYRPSDGD